jgi:hypothetical protein
MSNLLEIAVDQLAKKPLASRQVVIVCIGPIDHSEHSASVSHVVAFCYTS